MRFLIALLLSLALPALAFGQVGMMPGRMPRGPATGVVKPSRRASVVVGRYANMAVGQTNTNPLKTGQDQWCVSWSGSRSASWSATQAVLWGFGTYTGANSAAVLANTDGKFYLYLYGASASRIFYKTHGFSAGSAHTLMWCNDNGVATIWVDGALSSGWSATGTPPLTIAAMPATIVWGQDSGGARQLDGAMTAGLICRSADPARCR